MTIKKEIQQIRDSAWKRQEDTSSNAETVRVELDALWEAIIRVAERLDDSRRD